MYLLIKNGKPLCQVLNPERAIQTMKDCGSWILWDVWDMSYIPPKKVVDYMKLTSYTN